jgi:hypothetical protein
MQQVSIQNCQLVEVIYYYYYYLSPAKSIKVSKTFFFFRHPLLTQEKYERLRFCGSFSTGHDLPPPTLRILTFDGVLFPVSLAQHQTGGQYLVVVLERRVHHRVVLRGEGGRRQYRPLRRHAFDGRRLAFEVHQSPLRRLRHLPDVLRVERAPRRRRRRFSAPAQTFQLAEHCRNQTKR